MTMTMTMSLRWRLWLYLAALHLVFFALTLVLYHERPWLLLALEVLLLASFTGGLHLIRRALEPLAYTRRFHELLQDQNYAARLQPVQGKELGELVDLFNRMLTLLYQERLELGEQRGFLEKLLQATPSAVLVFDFDQRISLLNASAQALLGLHEPGGKPLRHWLTEGSGAGFTPHLDDSARQRSLSLIGQLDALAPDESHLLTDVAGRRYRAQKGHFTDRGFARQFVLIDELTQELEESERSTYEKLVRVLAHEVNNTVAATRSVLESLLYYRLQLIEADQSDFETAILATQRRNASLAEFIERFTRVVKMPSPELRPTLVTDLLDDILWLYREPCKAAGIRMTLNSCADLSLLPMDRPQMEQALLNIVKNALEAVQATMAETASHSGRIHLELSRQPDAIQLTIRDSGNRLGDVSSGQLFTPFFSTKKGGQGIGLLFVREVLQRHGFGYRLVPSGQGETCFDIWLPIALEA